MVMAVIPAPSMADDRRAEPLPSTPDRLALLEWGADQGG